MKQSTGGDLIDIDEALDIVMRNCNKTRRQARAMLVQAMSDGRLPATGINPNTGEREVIPPEAWPTVH
jgi:hypothetical protein